MEVQAYDKFAAGNMGAPDKEDSDGSQSPHGRPSPDEVGPFHNQPFQPDGGSTGVAKALLPSAGLPTVRKVLTPAVASSLAELAARILAFEATMRSRPKPIDWQFTSTDFDRKLADLTDALLPLAA
jgi:hypothetical protein